MPRDGAWRRMLAVVLGTVGNGLPPEGAAAVRGLSGASAEELDGLAGSVLRGEVRQDQLAAVPFVGAALQAWLAALAAGLDPAAVPRADGACAVCGGPPLAAVIGADRLRYVTCALCAAEWNVPRVQCVLCGGEQIEYLHAEGDRGAQAEACRTCRGYVKLFDAEKRPGADAAADDAATIALDLLVADEGYHRGGPNLYVAAGQA